MKNEKEYFIAETRKNEYFHNQDQNVVKYRKKDNKKFFLGSGLEELETAVLEGEITKLSPGFVYTFQSILKSRNLLLISGEK